MITIVLTNRNRDLRIVKNCLDSLQQQSDQDFEWFLVDYGSNEKYLKQLTELVSQYPKLNYISCPVSGQLWNKSRAINIVLNQCATSHFFVGDIDMIYQPDFVKKNRTFTANDEAVYFKVGFLSKEESELFKDFSEYQIAFPSTHEATGMTLYPTPLLKQVNGFDEFYHGWGAEDTDVHVRMRNLGAKVTFYDAEVLMLHQWHPKAYRSKNSKEPFHSYLEAVNHKYLQFAVKNSVIKANTQNAFGVLPDAEQYQRLTEPSREVQVTNEKNETDAFLNGGISNLTPGCYHVEFSVHPKYQSFKNKLKSTLGKKALEFYTLEEINDKVLMQIIAHFRNIPYCVDFQKSADKLILKIKL